MRAYRVVVAFITTALMLTLQAPLQAQCDLGWVPGPIITPPTPDGEGPDGNVYAIISWNLPTQPAQLIVGGDFTHIGGIAAHHIASWDGTLWHPLGGGIGGPVYALTTYGVNLIAGGQFSTPGACVASWDGTVWSSVANIYSPPEAAQPAHINALAVYNGELYMGGVFEVVDSQAATNCAIYNSVTGARPGPGLSDAVNALQTFDDDGSGPDPQFLYIGGVGGFSSIKKYDGVATTSIGTPNGAVLAMTVVDAIGPMPAGLIVAGHFGTISPPGGGNTILASNIARWDGTAWSTLGNGVSGTVGAVRAFGGNLIAGGSLGTLGGVSLNNLGKWDGSAWSSFNGGLPPAGNEVNELREFNGRLVIGGSFTATTSTGGSAGNLI
jgi:hypothetical protein